MMRPRRRGMGRAIDAPAGDIRSVTRDASAPRCGGIVVAGPLLDRPRPSLYNPPRSITPAPAGSGAQVAQLVEHVTENHGVGGSIPPLGTTSLFSNVR